MRRVIQKDEYDCGVACVAMVRGCNYEVAKKVFKKIEFSKRGSYPRDLTQALKRLHVDCRGKFISFEGRPAKRLLTQNGKNAIVKVKTPEFPRKWHWIVWDAKGERWLDPEENPKCRYKRPRCISYLEIG
jgi:Peptidase C39 family